MALPQFLQPCLASYDLSQLAPKRDKEIIITEILNKGNDQAVKWLGKTYTLKEIKEVVASPIKGMWLENNLVYWHFPRIARTINADAVSKKQPLWEKVNIVYFVSGKNKEELPKTQRV